MEETNSISSAELEVLQILWKSCKPMCVHEVLERLSEKNWTYRTIAVMLLRMERKNIVASEKFGRINYYTPVLSKAEYTHEQTRRLISVLYNNSAKELMISLIRRHDITKEDVEEIYKMFEG